MTVSRRAFALGSMGLVGLSVLPAVASAQTLAALSTEDRATLARRFGATDIVAERDREGVDRIREFGVQTLGWQWLDFCQSPIQGPAGNVEFLSYWRKNP